MRAWILALSFLASMLVTASVRSQPSGCSAFSTETFNIYDETGRIAWRTPEMECVEYFHFTVSTPHGERHIRGIGDINVAALMPAGGVAAIESGARASAARFADLGDYKISDIIILITGVDAEPDTLVNPERDVWKHASALADAIGRRTSTEGVCPVRLFTINDTTSAEMEQIVAHELFHCVQFGSLSAAQNRGGASWWVEGSAMLFANHVFPDLAPVLRRERKFRNSIETQTPIHRMAYEALYPFLFYNEQAGIGGLLPLLRSMPTSAGDSHQIRALNAMMAPEQWLQFARDVDDGKIRYINGEQADFGDRVSGETWTIDRSKTVRRTLKPFVLSYGWTDYQCGLWGNSLQPAASNLSVRKHDDDRWLPWPAETDCREKGSERYRVAAIQTESANVGLALQADRRIACESCLGEESVIDMCLVGSWEQTGGGPWEWLKNTVRMPITRDNVGMVRVTMNDDGTMMTAPVNVDVQFTERDDGHISQGTYSGTIAPSAGRWSASGGRINACFDGGGQMQGTLIARGDDVVKSGPFSVPGYAGEEGSASYSCTDTTLRTEIPMSRGGILWYEFRRTTPRRRSS